MAIAPGEGGLSSLVPMTEMQYQHRHDLDWCRRETARFCPLQATKSLVSGQARRYLHHHFCSCPCPDCQRAPPHRRRRAGWSNRISTNRFWRHGKHIASLLLSFFTLEDTGEANDILSQWYQERRVTMTSSSQGLDTPHRRFGGEQDSVDTQSLALDWCDHLPRPAL